MITAFEHYMKAEKYESHVGREAQFETDALTGRVFPYHAVSDIHEIVPYLEKLCELAMNEKFVVGPRVASWLDIRGFHIHKMCSRNHMLDVIVIEPAGQDNFIAFDMAFKTSTVRMPSGKWGKVVKCRVWQILENNLLPEDELLLKIVL